MAEVYNTQLYIHGNQDTECIIDLESELNSTQTKCKPKKLILRVDIKINRNSWKPIL